MKIFDALLLNLTIIIVPLMVYLLYNAYIKTLNKKEDNIIFVVAIISQIYLIFKYGSTFYKEMPLLIIDLPLIISYYKKSDPLILAISFINIIYCYIFYDKYLLIIIIEYIIYYFIKIKNKDINKFISVFWIIKIMFISYYKTINYQIISEIAFLYIISIFTIYILQKTEDMLKIHHELKKISKEKEIKTTLFKITHEIKNPIAVCKGYLDMYDENNQEKIKKYVPIIKEEINRTLILLEDFLAMNKLTINNDIVDINLLLKEVVENMNLLFKDKKIKIINQISEDEIYINADYNRLTQVFINIFKNSIEALENKKNPKIKIWTELINKNIIINIEDNGEGISKKDLEKIKVPFYTTKSKGTGLGVSLSNEIINAHKGRLTYKSEKNKYTKVTISLPLEKAI